MREKDPQGRPPWPFPGRTALDLDRGELSVAHAWLHAAEARHPLRLPEKSALDMEDAEYTAVRNRIRTHQ